MQRNPSAATANPVGASAWGTAVGSPDAVPTREAGVGLVGLGFHTGTVADLCEEAGLRVGFAVDDRDGADGDPFGAAFALAVRGIPLLPAAAFAQRVWRNPGLALVAGRVDCAVGAAVADDSFVRAAEWVRRTVGPNALLHPAALLERVPPTACPNRYAVFGFPGSGNVLTQHLIGNLYARRPLPPPPIWVMRAGLAEYFFHSTVARIRAAMAPLNPTHIDFIPHEFGTMMVAVECGPSAAAAFNVPSHRHHGLRTFPTHSRPTRQAVDYFEAAGAPCLAVVRHPCETLLSQANKLARPARRMFDHPRFLTGVGTGFADWTRQVLANRDRLHVVRYEDLAARRIDVLRRLAGWLDLPVSAAEAAALYDAHLNRNLPAAVPTHFHRGGNDKWRGEYSPAHLRHLRRHVPDGAFTAFGYDIPTAADLVPTPVTEAAVALDPIHAALLEVDPVQYIPGPHGMYVTGSNPDLVEGLLEVFSDPALLALFAAGGLTADNRPAAAIDLAAA